MTIIVRKIDDVWTQFIGEPTTLVEMVSTIAIHFADGRVITDVPTDPYPVEVMVDPAKIYGLVDRGEWGADDLARYGLRLAVPFVAPEGKIAKGPTRFVEADDEVREDYELVDPPPPPAQLTAQEKLASLLAAFDLTVDDVRAIVSPAAPPDGT